MSPWDRAGRRMNYAKGNTENKYTLMTPRTYGEPALLDLGISSPPSLNDINSQPAAFKDRYWSAPIFRIGVIAIAYCEYNTSDIVIYKMNTHLILKPGHPHNFLPSIFLHSSLAVAFPLFIKVFYNFRTVDADDFDTIVGQIAPNGKDICSTN